MRASLVLISATTVGISSRVGAPGLCLDGCVDAVEVRELGAIALDRRGIAADHGDCLIQLGLTAAGYKHPRAFCAKRFAIPRPMPALAAGNESDFACELACHSWFPSSP